MVRFDNLRTARQIVEASKKASGGQHLAITEGGLRWLIFRADQNGLDEAIVRVGGRVLIDVDAFNQWLERGRESAGRRSAP